MAHSSAVHDKPPNSVPGGGGFVMVIAVNEFDPSRDEDRHKLLLTLLAEEVAKDKKPRS
jgi:hypothetical protein